jgi:glycosyltransferase involved in cell wall biosynthesis
MSRIADFKRMIQQAVHAPSIVFVLPGIDAGGSEHVVTMLANAFAERMCDVTLVAFTRPGAQPFYSLDARVAFKPVGLPPGGRKQSRPWNILRRMTRLRKLLKAMRPDLVISFLPRTNVVTLLARPDCPVIVSERNNAEQQRLGRTWKLLQRILYPRASALVTMTAGAMKQFDGFQPPVTRVIPNHAATCPSRASERTGSSLVAVGRLVRQKGFDLLLEAFARIAPKHKGWTLTIWGEGEERRSLENQREELGLAGRVNLPGVTSEHGSWTHDADLFVLSSRFEGWGLVVGEALAAGIPTIAFDCDFGPSEMITNNETGILVPALDVEILARELERLMGDPGLRKRLSAAGPKAMRRFEPASIINLWIELINQFVAIPNQTNECRHAA